jgi:arsenite-transporting ATPase
MTRPLTIFCGKGGVGKTTLSLAFALWHAGQGRRALVVTSHPLAELALSVSLDGLKQKQPQAAANLFVTHIDPREVIAGTVKESMPSALLADAVLSSRIYQSLIEIVPGLKEFAFVSRIQQLAEQGFVEPVHNKFDLLVWDAPATGHFLRTLEVSRNFDSYLSGPLALLGKDLVKFFSDP